MDINKPFTTTLTLVKTSYTRNSVNTIWEDVDSEEKYCMTPKEYVRVVQNNLIDHGKLSAEWILKKRGNTVKIYLNS